MVTNPPAKARDTGLIPGWGRSPGEGNDNPLQYSCLGNPMNRRAWWATVHGVTKELDTMEKANNIIAKIMFKTPYLAISLFISA